MTNQQASGPEGSGPETKRWSWSGIITLASLVVLGLTPWTSAQQATPDLPAYCPPLTAFASPTLFDVFFGTTPIRFPYQ